MQLLLLHGAIGSKAQLEPLAGKLKPHYQVHTLDFSGHGGRALPEAEFSIALFAADVLKWMEDQSMSTVDIFGYSMGGYVALYLAKHHPEKIGKVFTLATKFNWTPEVAASEVKMLNPGKIAEKIPAFAETLAKRHEPVSWKTVLEKTGAMMLEMGNRNPLSDSDFKSIEQRVVLSVGDSDKMVSLEETKAVHELIPGSSLLVLPSTAHPIESVNTEMLFGHIRQFFN